MKLKFSNIIYIYFFTIQLQFAQIAFIGNTKPGFTFALFPEIKVDYFNQFIFVCSKESIAQPSNSLSYSVSVSDIKNNANNSQSNRFIPIITKNALVNGVLESNPLYANGFANFELLLGLELEPKFYPLLNPINSSQLYIMNNLEIYNNQQNNLVATDPLLDINLNEGEIVSVNSLQNQFIAGVIEKNTVFGGANSFCQFYQYGLKESIIPIPGSNNYITLLKLDTPTIFSFSNQEPSLCTLNENSVTLLPNYLTVYGNQSLNKGYIGVSGQGITGIKAVTLYNQPILLPESEAALNGNNIIATNNPNTNLYIDKLSSLFTTTNLSYLVVLGGTNDPVTAYSSVYALPLINNSPDNNNLIGTLANVNQSPIVLFDNSNLGLFLGNTLTEIPIKPGDLYTNTSVEAQVGGGPLILNNGVNNFQLAVNSIEGFKDTVFAATSYVNNDGNGVGGVFYSQALFNELGMIKGWSKWQRKNIYNNCRAQAYIPTMGSNIAIYEKIDNQVFANEFSPSGPFLGGNNPSYKALNCAESGIEKIIDIPHTHPGIGININPIIGFKPSYLIAVGYNSVIIQQTAKNNALLPILNGTIVNCIGGDASNIDNKNYQTNMVTFSGGELDQAGALFTAALGYSDLDAWIIVAGANGVYILTSEDGTGTGPTLLQDNFTGIRSNLKWQKLGNFHTVKKIVSNKNLLYVVTDKTIYKVPLTATNISLKKNCQYDVMLKNNELPNASPYTSFSDAIFSNNSCLIATSVGLFINEINNSIKNNAKIAIKKIDLPEAFGVMPVHFYPITLDGNQDSWANGPNTDITGNIYLVASSLTEHYSKIYRLVCYGSDTTEKETIFLLNNYFLQNIPTYYYNPNIEVLSIATDGASLFTHGVYGSSFFYKSYVGILNPFIRHGNLGLKNEYNFFELYSKMNNYFGFPTYISGIGIWLFASQNGIEGLC